MDRISQISALALRVRGLITSRSRAAESLLSDTVFNERALELFELQFRANASYRRLCESRRSLPSTVEHWSRIPAMPTSAFKEFELSCLPPAQRTHVFHSSGTTEHRPSRHFHSAESLSLYEASLLSWFESSLSSLWPLRADPGSRRFLSLTPPPSQAPHSSLVHMFGTLRQASGAPESAFVGQVAADNSWLVDFEATQAALASAAAANSPVLVLGTAFSFVQLSDWLQARAVRLMLPRGSCVLETGGYKGRSREMPKHELHGLVTALFGVSAEHIVSEYGMSELSSQAYDCVSGAAGRRLFRFPPWARVQLVSPETGLSVRDGETGLVRIFDLANVFSVMALQTEDLGVRRGEGFELIGRAAQVEPRGCSLTAAV
jgi:hypothetical protein